MFNKSTQHVAYNENDNTLKITFQTGALYAHYDVVPSVHLGLVI
ncbi:KTSC domain-containing protein [Parapedobacter flavus]